MSAFRRNRIVARGLGLLLLVAAGLKVYGIAVEPLGASGVFAASGIQMAVVQFELILGVWLLWGIFPLGSWLLSVVTFTAFAGVSAFQVWEGRASCGCFGQLTVSPWYALAVDLVALTALYFGRPDLDGLRNGSSADWLRRFRMGLRVLASTAGIFGLMIAVGCLFFGSVDGAVAALRGEEVSIRPRVVDVGRGASGDRLEASVELINRTDRPIRIVGGTSDCSCLATTDLPVTLPPGESRSVTIHVALRGNAGRFTRDVGFVTADDRLGVISFRVTGRIDKN